MQWLKLLDRTQNHRKWEQSKGTEKWITLTSKAGRDPEKLQSFTAQKQLVLYLEKPIQYGGGNKYKNLEQWAQRTNTFPVNTIPFSLKHFMYKVISMSVKYLLLIKTSETAHHKFLKFIWLHMWVLLQTVVQTEVYLKSVKHGHDINW